MEFQIASAETLGGLCAELVPAAGMDALLGGIQATMPELTFRWALTRGGWHRLGGVVDVQHRRVATNISHWVEECCGDDIEQLLVDYADAGYFATRLAGKTHFFTAACGERSSDFVQVEVEQLQELVERPLVDEDSFPDSVEEFLEPLAHAGVEMCPVGPAYYRFRRVTVVSHLLGADICRGRQMHDLKRFLMDWDASSAGDHAVFCEHWVLALREYIDSDGERQVIARPVPAGNIDYPEPPAAVDVRGVALAGAIHGYDRQVGYPFAWYFMMLSQKGYGHALADAVLADQMGAYDYLPRRDLKVLREWEERRYGV
jgi:hypothetical protein